MTYYGADPTGKNDSTGAILRAISDAVQGPGYGLLIQGIVNLGGVRIDLDGGIYKINRPLRLPKAGLGNLMVKKLKTLFSMLYFYDQCLGLTLRRAKSFFTQYTRTLVTI